MTSESDPDPGGVVDPEGAVSSRRLAWIKRLVLAFGLTGMAVVFGVVALVWPYFRDDLLLDRTVRAVALDWRDFGHDKAQTRLEYELDHLGIGMQVSDGDCGLFSDEGGVQAVRCEWGVDVVIPGIEVSVPLRFQSVAEIGVDGSLQ
jgi:hypothetical protein